jgi:hypothetical protein
VRFSVVADGRKARDHGSSKTLSCLMRFHAVKCGRCTGLSGYR